MDQLKSQTRAWSPTLDSPVLRGEDEPFERIESQTTDRVNSTWEEDDLPATELLSLDRRGAGDFAETEIVIPMSSGDTGVLSVAPQRPPRIDGSSLRPLETFTPPMPPASTRLRQGPSPRRLGGAALAVALEEPPEEALEEPAETAPVRWPLFAGAVLIGLFLGVLLALGLLRLLTS